MELRVNVSLKEFHVQRGGLFSFNKDGKCKHLKLPFKNLRRKTQYCHL